MHVTYIYRGLSPFLTSDLGMKQRHHRANDILLACWRT